MARCFNVVTTCCELCFKRMQQQNDNHDNQQPDHNLYDNGNHYNYKNLNDNSILFYYYNQRDDNIHNTDNNLYNYLTYRTSQRSRRNFPKPSVHQMV